MKNLFFIPLLSLLATYCLAQTPLSQKEQVIREKIDNAIASKNTTKLASTMCAECLFERIDVQIEENLDRSKEDKAELFEGFKIGLNNETGFFGQLNNSFKAGAECTFLNSTMRDVERGLIYRFLHEDGLNYYEWIVEEVDGNLEVVDIYMHSTGELISKSMKDIFAVLIPENKDLEQMTTSQKDIFRLKQSMALAEQGKFENALSIYSTFSPSFQELRATRVRKLELLSQYDWNLYLEELQAFQTDFPDDTSLDLMFIDLYFLMEDYNQALEATRRIDEAVHGDPYLSIYKGNCHFLLSNVYQAHTEYQIFTSNFPDDEDGQLGLFLTQIGTSDAGSVLETAKILHEKFFYPKKYLKSFIKMNKLVKKDARIKAWLKQN